ncbi:MAG: histidine kinase [Leptospira sp.]|nr:histidine kinase [Leptospira sp.]
MNRFLWERLESFLTKPILVISLFSLTIISLLHFLILSPILSNQSIFNSSGNTKTFSSDSYYLLGDLPKMPDGKYNFKSTNDILWPKFDVYVDTDSLVRLAASEIVWIRVDGIELEGLEERYCMIDHNGTFFQVYNDSGDLLFQYGDPNEKDNLPKFFDNDFSWVNLGSKPSKFYYVKNTHRKDQLFGVQPVQNRIGSKHEILTKFAKSNLLSLYLHSFFVIIGLICSLVYFTQYEKKYYTLLDFSVFTFLIGILGFTSSDFLRFLSNDRHTLYLISTICANIVYIPMHSGLKRLFGPGKWNILTILIFSNIIIGIFNTILGFNLNDNPDMMVIFLRLRFFYLIFAIMNFLGPIIVAYYAWKRGIEIALGHVIGFSFTLVLVSIEIYLSIQDQTSLTHVAYWGVLFGVFAQGLALEKIFFSNRQRMQQFEASLIIAEKSLQEVQLKTLQTKLSPHYLFNSLNTIHALHQTKAEHVGDAILRLANNYRFLSDKADLPLIPFNEEWSFIEDFLHLQKLRFYDTVKIHLTKEGDFNNVLIPPLTLQPIVENSFKHGFRYSSSTNWMIDITAKIDNKGNLHLKIADTGAGIDDTIPLDDEKIWSRSLGNIKTRLLHHYSYANIKITKNNPSGLVTTILIEKPNSL